MSRTVKIAIAVALYLTQGFYTYGSLTADAHWMSVHEWAVLDLGPRDHVGVCVVESLLPVGFVIAAIATNFNEHGWELWWHKGETP